MAVLDKFKDTIKKFNLIEQNDTIVVGVSGGPDSVALLYLLSGIKKEFNLQLHVVHVDHKLRKDSSKDRLFVSALAKKLNLPITSAQINIKKQVKLGSLEEIARNARLAVFFETARKINTKKIALGHNFDDQAETVLMRILRGCGLYGLAGILPKRDIQGYELIRPLIKLRRQEIMGYLKKRRISPRIDKSNLEDIYFRNKIRNKLLPLLEREYNSNVKEVLNNLAETACLDYEYLISLARIAIKKHKRGIEIKKLLKLHPALQRIVLRLAITNLTGNTRRISFKHIREIEDLILHRPTNSVVDLPKGIRVVKKRTRLEFLH